MAKCKYCEKTQHLLCVTGVPTEPLCHDHLVITLLVRGIEKRKLPVNKENIKSFLAIYTNIVIETNLDTVIDDILATRVA